MLAFAHGLSRGSCETSLILLSRTGPLERLLPDGITVIDLARSRLRQALPLLLRRLRELRPDVVVSSFGYVNLALLASRRCLPSGTRLVLREANLPSLALPQVRFGGAMGFGYRRLYRRADRVICSSGRMADEFAESFAVPRTRLAVVPNPVDEAGLRLAAAEPSRTPGPGPRFIAAGRLVRQKGFERLLSALAELPGAAQLTIFGEGPDREALIQQAERFGISTRVTLPGFVSDVAPYYAGADAFVMPSRWEGMPNAALEALACGTPVIATPESGGIAKLAAAAPPGAVTVAAAGDAFVAAMRSVETHPTAAPRPSLLPEAYQLENAVAAFEAVLSKLGE